jgi:hypothetical protein
MAENNYESTFIEPPETPAHQFAVKAFKHALFGTPAPEDANDASKKNERKAKLDAVNAKAIELPAPKEKGPPVSPSKQPGGILMTPGTASKGRKQVSFGSQVVDNEGKRGNIGKSGIPSDCPGKFPSPWTPGTQLKPDPESETRPRTRLTEALLDARTTTQPKSGQKPKARDDSDITIDLGAPRSESGRYWKEQYEGYAEKSEKEMKKVIAKQQLAKKFAMKKDGEVTELTTKLEQERKRYRQRERDLEQQNKDLQERLRQAMAESMSSSIEIAALKARVTVLESSTTSMSSSEQQQHKAPFDIYEDASKEAPRPSMGVDMDPEISFVPSPSMASSGKENSSPKPRRQRRQTIPDTLDRPILPSRLGTAEGEASIVLGKSPRAPARLFEATLEQALAPPKQEPPPKSPLKIRRPEPTDENNAPKSPAAVLPSSPLPMPSPDPWMDMNNSSIAQMDKMALPSAGRPYTRPEWNPPPKQHRTSKSVSNARPTRPAESARKQEKNASSEKKEEPPRRKERSAEKPARTTESEAVSLAPKMDSKPSIEPPKAEISKKADLSPTDSKFDLSKITAHHAEGSAQVKHDRSQMLPVERKQQARRRLEERKKLKKNGATIIGSER